MDENKTPEIIEGTPENMQEEPISDETIIETENMQEEAEGALNEDTAVSENDNVKENVLAGIVGAFLFSLSGGILWYVLYQLGFIAGISALVGVIAAIKGYALFSKKENIKGIIISVIIASIVIIIAWYLCLATDAYNAYADWYAAGEIDYTITFAEAVRGSYLFLTEPDIGMAYLKDLGFGIIFGIIGCVQPVRDALNKAKKTKDNEEQNA